MRKAILILILCGIGAAFTVAFGAALPYLQTISISEMDNQTIDGVKNTVGYFRSGQIFRWRWNGSSVKKTVENGRRMLEISSVPWNPDLGEGEVKRLLIDNTSVIHIEGGSCGEGEEGLFLTDHGVNPSQPTQTYQCCKTSAGTFRLALRACPYIADGGTVP